MSSRDDVSVLQGIAVQDEGSTAPKVQLSIPRESSPLGTVLGDDKCILDFFVNDVEHHLAGGYEDDELLVTVHKSFEVRLKYKKTGFWVKLRMGYFEGCLLQTCYYIPASDNIIGLLGTPDNDVTNDWMKRDGTILPIPTDRFDRVGPAAYDYCTMNWCITDYTESIFHYNEIAFGYDFGYYNRCELEYGVSLAEFIEVVDETVVAKCRKELSCMMDALEGGLEFALEAVRIRNASLKGICFEEGGTCDLGMKCCEGFVCTDSGMEKICSLEASDVSTCVVSTRDPECPFFRSCESSDTVYSLPTGTFNG